ncbi:mannosyltransferase [Tieghemiomyces parasiticus]|uniref:Chitobiosyldiphosphodolichol beta-mannosyltransferase n=1 Tax=Tieghemiomyces parasiticus TaxID=78921 RepID=A0A9W7ZJA7_9FUNG|nr:mannosyltransferase [Tieghemiomyces parasiticus]
MQNHALALAENGFDVDLVGYKGAKPPETLLASNRIRLHHLQVPWRPPPGASRLLFLANAPVKILLQILQLLWLLTVTLARPDFLLVQNPPAIPTLLVAQVVCWLRGIRLVIDWHNFGYTILALNLGSRHPAVRIAEWYERVFGARAYAHLCVTDAMAEELRDRWHIHGPVVVLHDRAPAHFHRLTLREAHKFWCDLTEQNPDFAQISVALGGHALPTRTLFTEDEATCTGEVLLRPRVGRPRVLVSSTSWTADEDFSVLLRAARRYDALVVQQTLSNAEPFELQRRLPPLVLLITGRGPQRAFYEAEIRRLDLHHVRILTLWLTAEDYPRLLGAADLGVSLHQSSSGLDLPMKVVDMFGCGLPVCAVRFQCIGELVRHGRNGWVFDDGEELARQWQRLFGGITDDGNDELARAKQELRAFQSVRWSAHWRAKVLDVFTLAGSQENHHE